MGKEGGITGVKISSENDKAFIIGWETKMIDDSLDLRSEEFSKGRNPGILDNIVIIIKRQR